MVQAVPKYQFLCLCENCSINVLLQTQMVKGKVKVKRTLLQALKICTGRTAQSGSRGIALLFLDLGTRRGEVSVSRPDRSLPPGNTRYPLYRGLGWPQGRSGQVRKISPPTGIQPPEIPARSQSLYRPHAQIVTVLDSRLPP